MKSPSFFKSKDKYETQRFNKTGLLGLGAATLSGCNKEKTSQNDELKITPKQTATYEFSCPLPFNYKTIDEIVELNKTLKKSKITTLYNALPEPFGDKFNKCVQIIRGENNFVKSYDDFFKYVNYAKSKGFEFTYLMNSTKPISIQDFNNFKDEFKKLLDLLIKRDIKNIKVANTQVAELINQYIPSKFTLSASTAFEYHSIQNYANLFNNYPNFNLIDITYDENQNFRYLKSLKNKFPKIKLELIVNEPCMKFCPARISHVTEDKFARYDCKKIGLNFGAYKYFIQSSYIYPWVLEYYSALGINNFKFSANGFMQNRAHFNDISGMKIYLNIIEQGLDNFTTLDFNLASLPFFYTDKKLSLSDIKPLFPDIRYFISHGHECNYRCGVNCNYCFECAKKLEKVLLYS